jgi:hypothetical protein
MIRMRRRERSEISARTAQCFDSNRVMALSWGTGSRSARERTCPRAHATGASGSITLQLLDTNEGNTTVSRKNLINLLLVIASVLLAVALFIAGAVWRGRKSHTTYKTSLLIPPDIPAWSEHPAWITGDPEVKPVEP